MRTAADARAGGRTHTRARGRPRGGGATPSTTAALTAIAALTAAGCGDTLQDQPINPAPLEAVIAKSRYPVYWTGLRFRGLEITGVTIDPGGAVTIQYGDCQVGGQYTCVAPLAIVTSPDNSFLPGDQAVEASATIRGAAVRQSRHGTTWAMRTGSVVVNLYARSRRLAREAAVTMTPLNKVGLPGQPLPPAAPDTGFDAKPLRSQIPVGAP